MAEKILIVEDELIVATDLKIILERTGYTVCGIAKSVDRAIRIIQADRPDIVLLDIFLQGEQTGIDLAKILREDNIPFVFLSANSNQEVLAAAKTTQPYGFLVKPFREKDVLITLDIANYRHRYSKESKVQQERLLVKQILEISGRDRGWESVLVTIAKTLQRFLPFDYLSAGIKPETAVSYNALGLLRIGFDQYQKIGPDQLATITKASIGELANLQHNARTDNLPIIYTRNMFEEVCRYPNIKRLLVNTFQLSSHMVLPIPLGDGRMFHFFLYSKLTQPYTQEHLDLCFKLQSPLSDLIGNTLGDQQPRQASQERVTTGPERVFKAIIGRSPQILQVLDFVSQVARTDTSVLILGESGTGKEGIAESIHQLSERSQKPLIKVNCAGLPSSLIESELFGHEKGAFTGAHERRLGKFEQAQGGSIFLDEIGEMPLEMQSKLLRVLQEKEIERIGGKGAFKVDVRIIAATNRNLETEVADGRFRMDLYYRLNVFPISVPPLRERPADIPLLAEHFISKFSQKFSRGIRSVSDQAMAVLKSYKWPGNVRELENLIERNLLLSQSPVIDKIVFLSSPQAAELTGSLPGRIKTIDEVERDHILSILKVCNGRIYGAGGAAELLNIPPTTLSSKIKRLEISRDHLTSPDHDI
jgi:DNA-binding NtrC family response regulator